jgi:diadenosine tetraphosphate (Ap4A) HIT family hydrolase
VNVGQAAGQTVMHAHIHLIPRHGFGGSVHKVLMIKEM